MMRRFLPRARRVDAARHHAVDRDAMRREVVRQRTREAGKAGLGGDHMRARGGTSKG